MADFLSQEIDFSQINNGQRFESGDGITPNAINAPIEAAFFAQEMAKKVVSLAETQPDVSEANAVGIPSVSIVKKSENEYQFAFANLKGESGADLSEDVNKLYETTTKNDKRISNLESKISNDAFITDTDILYQKIVPADVAPYAEIVKIGGMSNRYVPVEGNLFPYPYAGVSCDGQTATEENGVVTFITSNNNYVEPRISTNTVTLPAGTYIVDIGNSYFDEFWLNSSNNPSYVSYEMIENGKMRITALTDWTFSGINLELEDVTNQTLYLMIYPESAPITWTDRTLPELRHAKVTEIKSVGQNLCPKASITSDENKDGKIEIVGIRPSGKYTLSCWVTRYQDDSATKARVTIKFTYTDGTYDMTSGFWDYESVENDGVPRHKYVSLESNTTKTIRTITLICLDWGTVPSGRNAKAENIYLCYGTDTEYKPYVGTLDTFTIPNEVRNREGYGLGIPSEGFNYIQYTEDGRVIEVVKYKEVDLGTLTWYDTTSNVGNTYKARFVDMKLPITATDRKEGFVCARYSPAESVATDNLSDKGIIRHSTGYYIIRDSAYPDATSFKAAMAGVMLVYELAEPIVTDITDLMPIDNFIKVQGGGYITAENDYKYAVPTEILYQKRS